MPVVLLIKGCPILRILLSIRINLTAFFSSVLGTVEIIFYQYTDKMLCLSCSSLH
jgi:hypothetical protein